MAVVLQRTKRFTTAFVVFIGVVNIEYLFYHTVELPLKGLVDTARPQELSGQELLSMRNKRVCVL